MNFWPGLLNGREENRMYSGGVVTPRPIGSRVGGVTPLRIFYAGGVGGVPPSRTETAKTAITASARTKPARNPAV